MAKRRTVPVTARALIQRINRRLRKDADGDPPDVVRATRGQGNARLNLGDYYLLDLQRNCVTDTHLDIEELGRELNVLAAWERLSDEEGA